MWADEALHMRGGAGNTHFAKPLIVRATEEAQRHFLRRNGTEVAGAEGRIAAAVASMFRLTRADLDRAEAILRRHIALTPTAQGYA